MAASKNLGVDPALSASGDWLYKDGDLLLGPVQGGVIVQKLFAGELDRNSLVSPMGESSFRKLAEVEDFKVALAKAEAHRRVDAAARVEAAKVSRSRNVRLAIVATVAVVVAAGAAVGARYLAVHNPFKTQSDDGFGDITMSQLSIGLARGRHSEEELIDYPVGGPGPGKTRSGRTGAGRVASGKVNDAAAEPDGLQMAQFDNDAINSVVASHKRSLIVCFREESDRNPGFAAQIPLEFVIGNNGHVNNLWVDHPNYKNGPLKDCLFKELQKWPFKPYEGENPSVRLSFNVGKKG
ncbi:MAG TPA: AgmX/PglI C-terminal domain-containing protein [Myxococcaceae bacterium]|nr:AgmX/PglI C-terminal domain-containing protein [Myxococcaceae bacterium]